MGRIPIDDPTDPRLEVFQGLRDHVLRRRRETPGGDMDGLFIAEGDLVVERAVRAGYRLRSVLIDGRRRTPLPAGVDTTAVPVYAAGPEVLRRITGYHLHRGMLACFARRPLPPPGEVLAGATTVVVTEGINNPTNLGVILRCAAGFGATGVLLDPTSCDPLYRRAGRVSMGEAYALPHARIEPVPAGLAPCRLAGFRVVALTPAPGALAIDRLRLDPGEPVAVLLGAEGPGLSPAALDAADDRVRIPMAGGVDSLNVGAASAVAFYAIGQARTRG
ncbi:MAG: TrmH family RNA methyltransferase [Acidimicrobiales bacterium]